MQFEPQLCDTMNIICCCCCNQHTICTFSVRRVWENSDSELILMVSCRPAYRCHAHTAVWDFVNILYGVRDSIVKSQCCMHHSCIYNIHTWCTFVYLALDFYFIFHFFYWYVPFLFSTDFPSLQWQLFFVCFFLLILLPSGGIPFPVPCAQIQQQNRRKRCTSILHSVHSIATHLILQTPKNMFSWPTQRSRVLFAHSRSYLSICQRKRIPALYFVLCGRHKLYLLT